MAMENGPFEDVFPINGYIPIFHCYVSLPELSVSWAVGKHGGSGQMTGCSLEMLLVDGGL